MDFALIVSACAASLLALGIALYAIVTGWSTARLPRSFDSRLSLLNAELSAITEIIQRIDARDKMRKVRVGKSEATNANGDGTPNAYTNPIEWKAHMRKNYLFQNKKAD
jgi:hypothetical protein